MDYDLLETRLIISTLQSALDHVQARVRELERNAATANKRLGEVTQRCEVLDLHAIHPERERAAKLSAGAMQPNADVSP